MHVLSCTMYIYNSHLIKNLIQKLYTGFLLPASKNILKLEEINSMHSQEHCWGSQFSVSVFVWLCLCDCVRWNLDSARQGQYSNFFLNTEKANHSKSEEKKSPGSHGFPRNVNLIYGDKILQTFLNQKETFSWVSGLEVSFLYLSSQMGHSEE